VNSMNEYTIAVGCLVPRGYANDSAQPTRRSRVERSRNPSTEV
jgi:hypothetical protein